MEKGTILFNGNEKKIYATESPDEVLIHFTDIITCYNNVKRARVVGKGIITNAISSIIFETLTQAGIRNHFIRKINERDMLCRKIQTVPLELVVRNRVAGDMSHRFRMEDGTKLNNVVIDLYLNDNALGNPLINDHHAVALDYTTYQELNDIYDVARKVNMILMETCAKAELELVDLKLEFGRDKDGVLIISDEISPDTCRFWDAKTGNKLDKDRFRHDMSDVLVSYKEVLTRLQSLQTL